MTIHIEFWHIYAAGAFFVCFGIIQTIKRMNRDEPHALAGFRANIPLAMTALLLSVALWPLFIAHAIYTRKKKKGAK